MNSVALGAQSNDGGLANVVSIGDASTGLTKQIINVAPGVNGTDAVNLNQLDSAIQGAATTSAPIVANNTAARLAPTATGADSLSAGYGATATAGSSTAVGQGATATGVNSVAIGDGSLAGDANTVSIGAVGAERRLTNLAAGNLTATSTDGVNGAQLFATNQTVSVAQTTANTALADAQNAITYDNAGHTAVTLDAGGSTTIVHNLAAGVNGTDAVNVDQLDLAIQGVTTAPAPIVANNTAARPAPTVTGADSLSVG